MTLKLLFRQAPFELPELLTQEQRYPQLLEYMFSNLPVKWSSNSTKMPRTVVFVLHDFHFAGGDDIGLIISNRPNTDV